MSQDESKNKLRRVKEEILSSERTYVDDLTSSIDVFMTPLLAPFTPEGSAAALPVILTREQIQIVFNNLQVIISLNRQLLAALEQEHQDGTSSIGQIFLDLSPYLKMYTVFVKHHSEASALHQRLLVDSPRYSQFIEDMCVQHQSLLRNRTLADFLIMPVQRVPRYKLLLQELVKIASCTANMETELPVLQSALDKVTAVARMVNESIQEHWDRMKVLKIQQRLGDQVHLIIPHRKFVLEATLTKMCRRGPKLYEFFLFTDALVYASTEDEGLVYKRTLPLNVMTLVSTVEAHVLGFQLSSPQKSFIVVAPNEEVKEVWVNAISSCIQRWREYEQQMAEEAERSYADSVTSPMEQQQQQQQEPGARRRTTISGAAQQVNQAPVWVPDREAPTCQTCEIKFTFVNRKHHCRHCGHVVCNDCSLHRFILPNLGNSKPQRVCHECYLEMRDNLALSAASGGNINVQQGNRPAPPPRHRTSQKPRLRSIRADSSTQAAAGGLLNTEEKQVEDDSELASHWKVLLDDQARKYYWSTRTDVITYLRPPRAVDELNNGGRRTHISQRFGFKKRTSNVEDELNGTSAFISEYTSSNPRFSFGGRKASSYSQQQPEEESLTRRMPSPSLADQLANLANAGTFGDATKSRFSPKRINALASLASRRKSAGKKRSTHSSMRFFRAPTRDLDEHVEEEEEEEESTPVSPISIASPPAAAEEQLLL